ncbi:MAG: thiamine phosphate synthase [Planctomycetota bacterium]
MTPRRCGPCCPMGRALAFVPRGDPLPPPEVDYGFYGPVYDTASKRGLKEPVGVNGLRERLGQGGPPLWALGGIGPEQLAEVRASGAAGACVRGAIWSARRPERVWAAMLAQFESHG